MPSVNPVCPNLIAFAGQPVSGSTYNQDENYIYVMDTSELRCADAARVRAPTSGSFNPSYQGRAPWWSPDGKWVVFELNRPSQYEANGLYAIYLYEYGFLGPAPARQITSTIYNCNHAKWFPTGFPGRPAGDFQLIVAAWQNFGAARALGALWPLRAGPDAARAYVLISAWKKARATNRIAVDAQDQL